MTKLQSMTKSALVSHCALLEEELIDLQGALRRHTDDCRFYITLLANAQAVGPYPGVYLLVDGGQVVYVGQSKNVANRLSGHRDKRYSRAVAVRVDDAERRLEIEEHLIAYLKPDYNETRPATPLEKRAARRGEIDEAYLQDARAEAEEYAA